MEQLYDHYYGLWRGSAQEKVVYTEDYPEPFLVLREFTDGAIFHGAAKKIGIKFYRTERGRWRLIVWDNGRGLWNLSRFLKWAASSSLTREHKNGHGHKKALTKFAPDYKTAEWSVRYRKAGGNLTTYKGPFLGSETNVEESDDDITTLMPSGTETSGDFDPAILGPYKDDPNALVRAIKEILQTRYTESVLTRIEFQVEADGLTETIPRKVLNSRTEGWHSFRWHVERGVEEGYIRPVRLNEGHTSAGADWKLSLFKIIPKGTTTFPLKHEFPTYGQKNIACQRVHLCIGEQVIESAHLYRFLGKSGGHNDENGVIGFVEFTSAIHPQPATTKVCMYENDEIYKQFAADLTEELKNETYASDGEAPRPVVERFDKLHEVERALNVTFRVRRGQVLVDLNDGRGMRPITDFRLTPSTA